mmetsp:Transcript_11752/g.14619  ORF Transcript_11752/g.14619 Transcript_11752/m.14619 type:complete len:401 (-) Transcript_11752:166-1368(-)
MTTQASKLLVILPLVLHIRKINTLHAGSLFHHRGVTLAKTAPKRFLCSTIRPLRTSDGTSDDVSATISHVEGEETYSSCHCNSSILVCGDGDLSYSASISNQLCKRNIALTATVLESKEDHLKVYKNSQSNIDEIMSHGHNVRFGIDATQLQSYFPSYSFNNIRFNFPHWPGKANNRYNRRLLSSFLLSAANVASTVTVALCSKQGGASAVNLQEWRQSWLAAQYAAEAGLLLKRLEPFSPDCYDLSSHRGQDRPFHVGDEPELYTFVRDDWEDGDGTLVPPELQLCVRHELHVLLPHDDFVWDVEGTISQLVPEGIRVEIPIRDRLVTNEGLVEIYLVVYCGEGRALTRAAGDEYQKIVEEEVPMMTGLRLRESRRGRMVSRPFPYVILWNLIEDHLLL